MRRLVIVVLFALLAIAVVASDLRLFYGNPHSHTSYSDGTGTPEEAYEYGSKVPGLDFLAVTDHGYYFVQTLPDGRDKLTATIEAAQKATTGSFLAFAGFEWTATGTGHINVYGTQDWTDRVQSDLWQLYDWIIERKAVGQFNHPITMFGDNFKQFHYVPQADLYVNLIEVGNGNWWQNETISQEMFQAYRLALLKGWHLGATLGQDNHKPNWGGANDSRAVVYASGLTQEEILKAFSERRVYASEDRDILLSFSADGGFMGDILHDLEEINLKVSIKDETGDDLEFVEIYSRTGLLAHFDVNDSLFEMELRLDIETGYEYFFVYAKARDGEEVVSSPIWVQRSDPVHLYNPAVHPSNVKPGEEVTLSFQISNTSSQEASTTLELRNLHGVILQESYLLTAYESREVTLPHTTGNGDERIDFYLDSVPYSSVSLKLREATSLNVLLDRSHVNYAMDRREKLSTTLQEFGHKYSTVERLLKTGELDNINVLIMPLPGAGGSFERLKMLMPAQAGIIADFVRKGGTLIITGTGETVGQDIIDTYNKFLADLGLPVTFGGVQSGEIVSVEGISFDGISTLEGEAGEYPAGDGTVIIYPGDPLTDNVIEMNEKLVWRLF
ncbi:MAG TPA: CehA/McbA family metallohydrolase [Mesotoga sp.]|nr:CehA/McbA family metallohydrolase [Mesotoga sp.]